MWRNVGVMLFIFALPVMQVILFCLAIGGDPTGLKLAIVNHEVGYVNQTYQDCPFEMGCKFGNLSCRYIEAVNTSTITKVSDFNLICSYFENILALYLPKGTAELDDAAPC